MKKSLALSLCLLLAFSLFACKTAPAATTTPNTQHLTAAEIRALDESETIRGESWASLVNHFNSIEEITDFAEVIVKVEVVSVELTEPETYLDSQMTYTTVTILSTIKGNGPVGGTIKINELGGGQGYEAFVAGGVPVMAVGSQYILFLTEEYKGMRGVCGAFGRFIEKQGYMVQQTIEEAKINSYTPLPTEQFMQLIAGYVAGDNT
ncbi:MAG: hypothetical protein LBN02_05445 [Oscillospiraceae bacterium]|jgi:hypothetical protein|nr:hypothetical protein [Oscillospiraceae bacterium]